MGKTLQEINDDINIINKSIALKPKDLIISDLKWKILIYGVKANRDILMIGPSGTGKTTVGMKLAQALKRPFFKINFGSTQDPKTTLLGNSTYNKDSGTVFYESDFIKAIQTKNAVILVDEITRAHPEAWNICMTVFDPIQRYLRLDEHGENKIINVADGICFICTANIGREYTSTKKIDRALTDRLLTVEMDFMSVDDELKYLISLYPSVKSDLILKIVEIAEYTRKTYKLSSSKLSEYVSTRKTIIMTEMLSYGFSLEDIFEGILYPMFSNAGDLDSEQTHIKQYCQNKISNNTTTPF